MIRLFLILVCAIFITSCENTNVLVMAGAASDAVTAITLTDDEVNTLARRAAHASDSKHRVAAPGSPYDTRLRKLVAGYSERDGYSFNFNVYLTKDVNAFAMADGTVRVYSGLMDLLSDAELLFVIGHEMGHVVKKHSRRKVVLAYTTSALRKGLASQENQIGQIASSVIGSFAEQLTHAQFSQHEERQADQYGAAFLETAGHDIAPAVSALNKLAVLAKQQHTFLSSHPDPEARAEKLLKGQNSESDDQGSFLEKVLNYGQKIILGVFALVRYLLNWVIALF